MHFVPLAAIRDPDSCRPRGRAGPGPPGPGRGDLVDHLANHLSGRRLLLVLDNFERLLGAAPAVAELLAAGGGARMVVTSRSPLHLSGEQEFMVPPLPLPGPDAQASAASLARCESTALFVTRARAVVPQFAVDQGTVAAIADIVRRLDGLPLAIELAAARVKLLPPGSLLARLDDSLGLLVGGSRDLPDRQHDAAGHDRVELRPAERRCRTPAGGARRLPWRRRGRRKTHRTSRARRCRTHRRPERAGRQLDDVGRPGGAVRPAPRRSQWSPRAAVRGTSGRRPAPPRTACPGWQR